jgi:hypothetical protein
MVMLVKLVQELNALSSILVTEEGMVTLAKLGHQANAPI